MAENSAKKDAAGEGEEPKESSAGRDADGKEEKVEESSERVQRENLTTCHIPAPATSPYMGYEQLLGINK
ncbi:hypothetical protein NDU88_002068 [Pleurodeles waltl]|uniref:Uncharacterized protein n=1 Tax=Pleurodeles waltl TaxID=8319 RepID=A0AAV7NFB0_PLEWA|nr:hypothetical protein NDU88_002068 [Pleurodeles waltl]